MKTPRMLFLLLCCLYGIVNPVVLAQTKAAKTPEGKLLTREFKVEVPKLAPGLAKWGVLEAGGSTQLQDRLREYFKQIGVEGIMNRSQGSRIVLNEKTGVLRVKATKEDMELIQSAIDMLDFDPIQVQLEMKHIEMEEAAASAMGLKPFMAGMVTATNAWWVEESWKAGRSTITNVTVEGLFLPNEARVLPAEQLKSMIRDLEQRDGVNLMALPRVTTLDKRAADLGLWYDLGNGKNLYTGGAGWLELMKQQWMSAGVVPFFRVRPSLQTHGKSLRVDWLATMIKVVGYEALPGNIGTPTPADVQIPEFRVRQVTGSHELREGETLMIGCGVVETVTKGSLGRADKAGKWVQILMLTPTVIDRKGNPVKQAEKQEWGTSNTERPTSNIERGEENRGVQPPRAESCVGPQHSKEVTSRFSF